MEMQINSFGVLRGDPLLLKDKHQPVSGWEMVTVMDTDGQDSAELPRKSSLPLRLGIEDSN